MFWYLLLYQNKTLSSIVCKKKHIPEGVNDSENRYHCEPKESRKFESSSFDYFYYINYMEGNTIYILPNQLFESILII